MGTELKATLRVEVAGAATVAATHKIEAEAYDKIEVTVEAGKTVTVNVQPGAAGQVELLLITASEYSEDVTYKANGGSSVDLDAPQLLLGKGAVGLLGAIKKIEFKNDSPDNVTVQLLVGRDATPPPP